MPKKPKKEKLHGTPQMKLVVDEHGQVVSATHLNGNPIGDADYAGGETKRIVEDAILASVNWCKWKKIGGRWVCVPA